MAAAFFVNIRKSALVRALNALPGLCTKKECASNCRESMAAHSAAFAQKKRAAFNRIYAVNATRCVDYYGRKPQKNQICFFKVHLHRLGTVLFPWIFPRKKNRPQSVKKHLPSRWIDCYGRCINSAFLCVRLRSAGGVHSMQMFLSADSQIII